MQKQKTNMADAYLTDFEKRFQKMSFIKDMINGGANEEELKSILFLQFLVRFLGNVLIVY